MGFVCMLFIDNFNFKKGISKIGDKFFFLIKKCLKALQNTLLALLKILIRRVRLTLLFGYFSQDNCKI